MDTEKTMARAAEGCTEITNGPEVVEMCRTSPVNISLLVSNLTRERDTIKAFALISEAFGKEQGREDYQRNSEGEVIKTYRQTEDIVLLRCKFLEDVRAMVNTKFGYYCATPRIMAERERMKNAVLSSLGQWEKYGTIKERILPPAIDTPRARKVIAKAIEAGWIKETPEGCKWVGIKAAAAYFCEMVTSGGDITKPGPVWSEWGKFLGLSRLEQTNQANCLTKTERPWKAKIDSITKW